MRSAQGTSPFVPALTVALLAGILLPILLASASLGADPAALPSPGPDSGGLLEGGDPRSEGAGPGLVGAPLLILVGVVALGVATAAITVVLVRVTRRD
jgi:hypothetical protein